MKIFVVIDTNVLVSAALNWNSVPGVVIEKALRGKIIPVLNDEIVREYDEVLHRKKFGFLDEDIQAVIDGLKQRGIFLSPAKVEEVLPDEKDVIFYAVTLQSIESQKENTTYLVTGNLKHFPVKQYVISPRDFLTILTNMNI